MPDYLQKIPFREELLKAVIGFDCGDEEWERPLAAWIEADESIKNGALYEMRKRTGKLDVWLHVNGAGELVGYSALGASNWEWPTAENRHPEAILGLPEG